MAEPLTKEDIEEVFAYAREVIKSMTPREREWYNIPDDDDD